MNAVVRLERSARSEPAALEAEVGQLRDEVVVGVVVEDTEVGFSDGSCFTAWRWYGGTDSSVTCMCVLLLLGYVAGSMVFVCVIVVRNAVFFKSE